MTNDNSGLAISGQPLFGYPHGPCCSCDYCRPWNYPSNVYVPKFTEVLKVIEDKGEKAIKLVKLLKDKNIIKIEKVDELIDLLDILIKEL